MAGDKFKKVQAGKPLEIPANTWNSMVDAARHHSDQQHHQFVEGVQSHRRGDVVKVKNTTSVNINRFGILGLSQPAIGPAANLLEFSNRPVLTGVMPTLLHRGRFAVALEPIAPNRFGSCLVAGVTPVRVRTFSSAAPNRYADVFPNTVESLRTDDQLGSAQIIWLESTTPGEKWALVKLGNSRLPLTLTGFLEEDLYSQQIAANVSPLNLPNLQLPTIPCRNLFRMAADQGDLVSIYWDDSSAYQSWVISQVQHKSQYVVESLKLNAAAYGGSSSACDCQTLVAMRRKVQVAYCESESQLQPFTVGQVCGCSQYSSGTGPPAEMMLIEMPE